MTPLRRRRRSCPLLLVLLLATRALAQESTTQVEVRGDSSAQRRADTAGRQVVARDELLRHGDTRIADALSRVPGMSVDGRGAQVELKLGGLGGGYTQLLINGEPVPRGFSLDSIALDSLERVEIQRGASVQSTQAIAGTINLVTRRASALATRDFKLSLASQWGLPQGSATLNLGDRWGAATWGLGTVLSSERQRWPATWLRERREGEPGRLVQRTLTDKIEYDRTESLALNPRLSWQQEQADGSRWQLSTDHSLRYARSDGGVIDHRTPLIGDAPEQQDSQLQLHYQRVFWRGRAQLQHKAADGSRTEARLSGTFSRRDQQARGLGTDFTPRLVQDTHVDGRADDQSVVLNLNHQRPLGEAHRLDLGAELEQAVRREDRVQTELALPGGKPPDNLDERYDARVQRRALYLQDDWTLAAKTEVQLGLRLEQLHTDSQGNVFTAVRQSHRLVGPVLRLATTPEGGWGTFKLGLSRGFKLPAPRDVMPRRYVPAEVSPTAPAQTGNPELRPERAWSLDASWQRKWPALSGEMVWSAALRRIDDVVLDRLIVQPQDLSYPWLLQRFNAGSAWSASLELELRGEARGALIDGQPLRWQASLAAMRSRLDDVAGARPALVGQPDWQAKLDLTQPLAPAWTAQLGLQARGRALADQPDGRRLAFNAQHSFSADLSWQPLPRHIWRLSAQQWWGNDMVDYKRVQVVESGVPVRYDAREAWHRQVLWRLGYEQPF
jgi:outer membrane receptor for ferrienterochelin and colicins